MTAQRCPAGDFATRASDMLATEVLARLSLIDLLATGDPPPTTAMRTRRWELARLVTMWRNLLEAHKPTDGSGRCPSCRSWGGLRRRAWPCQAWVTAHECLITDPAARLW